MADEPDSPVLIDLRRLDAEMDRVIDDLADMKARPTDLEEGQAVMSRRMDGSGKRVERIERRLDLVDMPH